MLRSQVPVRAIPPNLAGPLCGRPPSSLRAGLALPRRPTGGGRPFTDPRSLKGSALYE